MKRIEFWNGQTSRKKKYIEHEGLVYTKHNPCLWTNVSEGKPWRNVYTKAIEYVEKWKKDTANPNRDTELLHALRYVAYGYSADGEDKRSFNNKDVVWPGNLTILHRPKLVYKNEETNENFTLYFYYDNENKNDNDNDNIPTKNHWKTRIEHTTAFYWDIYE